ncbi:CinA family protein [Rhizorhapis sp. SPR117]|uniref:CinA family protein n=1 Tax=Rhizorhapis sp. SPR117 TaxID=2912611 RepID=UPI001F28B0EB|nr:CinA family protein [Rhizorhapis sp. SPR117]
MSQHDDIALRVARLGKAVGTNGPSIVIAESCTGGMLCGAIVSDPDVSGALERGFVVYSIDAKCELLNLERERVEACAGVSKDIAIAMAKAALDRSHADIAMAITGFAGPQEHDEEVGLVHIALIGRDGKPRHHICHFGDVGREVVCRKTVLVALELLTDAAADP